jgi:hypothetical protein
VNKHPFDGFNSLMLYDMNLRPLLGNARWIDEFNPIAYENTGFFHDFLKHLNNLNICCAFVGSFPAYTAGVFFSHNVPTLAIAVTNSFLLDKILQRNGGRYHSFGLLDHLFFSIYLSAYMRPSNIWFYIKTLLLEFKSDLFLL